jgi:hypothetical protein
MANPRLVIAKILAGVTLALAAFGIIGDSQISGIQTEMPGHANLAASHFAGLSGAHVAGLISLALSVAAFVVSWRQPSYLVTGLLSAAGIIYTVHLAPFLGDHTVMAFPGPVVGLFFGHAILALGVAKGIGSIQTRLVQSPK